METKDLLIRPSVFEDIDIFYKWEREPAVTNFFSINKDQSFETVVRAYIESDDDETQRQYTIVSKENDKPIGRIVLTDLHLGWKVEVFRVYIADPSLRNKGLGRQSLDAVLKLCFEEFSVERVYLDYYLDNPASYLYKSMGFVQEGILRKNCRKDGELHDVCLMSMLKNEYLK